MAVQSKRKLPKGWKLEFIREPLNKDMPIGAMMIGWGMTIDKSKKKVRVYHSKVLAKRR